MKTHCLLFLFVGLLFVLCAQVPPASARMHPGICPKYEIGPCEELCTKDGDCRADEKCCSNSCGHLCMKAIQGHPPRTLGRCPRWPPGHVGHCALLCMDDSNCAVGQKCCSTGCGRSCMTVTKG